MSTPAHSIRNMTPRGRALVRALDPTFPLGRTVITTNVDDQLNLADVAKALERLSSGDWDELCGEDAGQNDMTMLRGSRIFSVYLFGDRRLGINSDANRAVTDRSLQRSIILDVG